MSISSKNPRAFRLSVPLSPSEPELRRRAARRSAVISLFLVYVGMPLELMMGLHLRRMPHWPPLVSMAVATVLWFPLIRDREWSFAISRAVFLINNFVIAAMLWLTTAPWAQLDGAQWLPFQAHKLSLLTAALIAPDLIVGLVTLAVYSGAALLQLALFDPAVRARVASGEPWPIFAFTLFSVVLLVARLRRQFLEHNLIEVRAERRLLRDVAARLLAVRDLANTPLQTIEVNAALVATVPGAQVYAQRMLRSVERLRRWHRHLETDWRRIGWSEESLAFDAQAILDRD